MRRDQQLHEVVPIFSYGSATAEGWASKIATFDRELARVSARARSQATQQAPDTAKKP